jgi:ABC-type multidrug transport system ATPase subunit
MESIVSCVGLSKVYPGGVTALVDITVDIWSGTSVGLLGENGAGKSTLLRLIMGFQFPSSGELRVFGERDVNLAHPKQ